MIRLLRVVAVLLPVFALGAALWGISFRNHDRQNQALVQAVLRGDDNEAIRLLDAGADPDARFFSAARRHGWPGIRDAVFNLLPGGSSQARHPASSWTVLMLAAETGRTDLVRELLAHGADVNARDRYGLTALTHAAAHAGPAGNDTVRLLRAHGAAPSPEDVQRQIREAAFRNALRATNSTNPAPSR